jgi:hypothetical protein
VARFDYDPVTHQPLGYLSEVQSTNGLLRSGDLSNAAAWTASGATANGNAVLAPDGTTSMTTLVESNANVAHKVSQAITLASATTAGFSFFVKARERSKFYISLQASAANYATAIFDTLNTGTAATQTSVGGTSGTIVTNYIRNVGNGVYRVSMTAQVVGVNPTVVLGLASLATGNTVSATGDVTYSGDGVSGGSGWGAQFDTAGAGVTSYIATLGSTVTRSLDLLTLALTSVPTWNAAVGGTLMAAYRLYDVRSTTVPLSIFDAGFAGNNALALFENYAGAGQSRFRTVQATILVDLVGAASPAPFVRRCTAGGWAVGAQQIAHAGTLDNTSAGPAALPVSLTQMAFATDNTNALNGALESVGYYPGAPSNAFVQQVSLL